MSDKTAVVLLNLGGPDSLTAVRGFLQNLFSDPDIFRLPLGWLTQKPFAWLIAKLRAPKVAAGYAAIGGRSPILAYTRKQAAALETELHSRAPGDFSVHVCMRYWHPMSDEVIRALKTAGYTRVILLPLYPQASGTTTGSSQNDFLRACARQDYHPEVRLIASWPTAPRYIAAICDDIRKAAAALPDPRPEAITLLLSAHGLPQKLVDAGDPYAREIKATVAAVRNELGWPDVTLCFQSKVGPLPWLKPYTADVIRTRGQSGCRQMLVYPIAFVSDHLETLFELGQEYAHLARAAGITHYRVVPALNEHPGLIKALADLALATLVRAPPGQETPRAPH